MINTIVIIEDEEHLATSLKYLLERKNFKVIIFLTAEHFFNTKDRPDHCIYLVDWNLPGIKGTDIIRTIRHADHISPIFIMSGNDTSDQVLEGLKCGADDYIIKPFNIEELVIRLNNAQLKMTAVKNNLLNIGIKLFKEANTIMLDGISVGFSEREFSIFDYLFKNKNQAASRDDIIGMLGKDMEINYRNIDVHVFAIRRKISKMKMDIETVRGVGYMLVL